MVLTFRYQAYLPTEGFASVLHISWTSPPSFKVSGFSLEPTVKVTLGGSEKKINISNEST